MDILISYAHREADLAGLSIEALAQQVLAAEEVPDRAEVSISFVDDATIAQLNERYRSIAGPTDVLSFECDSVADELSDAAVVSEHVYEVGDVIIAPDMAERQASEYGQSFKAEIELLLVHGLLHLCGYDHMRDDEARIMEAREEELLRAWRTQEGGSR